MILWVTGANGFIGRHLVRLLANRGHAVYGLGHGTISAEETQRLGLQEWLSGGISAANLDTLAARSGTPSIVFHLAGGASVGSSIEQPYRDFSRTVSATACLLEWLRVAALECRLVAASSAAVYGAGHDGPIAESAETLPMSPYGTHKLVMEQLCRSYAGTFGLRSTIVRLFSVYGAQLRKQLLWDICCRLQRGEGRLTLGGTGAELRDWVEVRDATRLLTLIAETAQQEDYKIINVGTGAAESVAHAATEILKNWCGETALQFSGVARPGDPASLVADVSELRRLSFTCQIPLAQGVADYVRWFRDGAV